MKPGSCWTLLSNHGHVLVCLANDPHMRLRDVAERVGITERAVQRIILDLEQAEMLSREREGRRNHYRINATQPLRHPLEQHHTVGELVEAVSAYRLK
jgi:DNA-binding MarR family transcriptional regulator